MSEVILADTMPDLFDELSNGRFEVRPLEPASDVDCAKAVAVVAYSHPVVDGRLLDRCPGVRIVSNHGVGVDHIDVAAAQQRGVRVGNTPGCLDAATADMTMAMILSVARNIVIGDHFARSPKFTHYDPSILIGQEVTGSTLGIVGMGRIGVEVARRARAFDMKILYHNRNRRPDIEDSLGVQFATLNDLLGRSDFVTLNCPLTEETHGLIGPAQFQQMKPSGMLINMARGPVIQTDALYAALTTGQITAAGLDVTDPEPLPRDHPLLRLDNVIVAPHLGSASNVTRRRMMQITVDNLIAGLEGRPLPHEVAPV
ncbi:MAG: D-glycerate dehydrogenase [Fuerstiella sp.]|nr:D-glycerate dehydrogenase [Fuerstiella sp.]MCP4784903.1 D-glycerate dehydrogenase [Fuerstiella sp.]MCP4859366.1 D-glycerate dehydrogenase [Fuerstiella sp.]